MDIAKLISEMTNEQAYQLMQKAELCAKTISEPTWSQEEGHWAKAVRPMASWMVQARSAR